MKTLKTVLFATIAFVSVITVSSCSDWINKDSNQYDAYSWGTVSLTISNNPTDFTIITDDSLALYVTNIKEVMDKYAIKDGQRVIVYYKHDKIPERVLHYSMKINPVKVVMITDILTKNILHTTKIDTMVNAGIDPLAMWISNNVKTGDHYLNIKFRVLGATNVTHYINLVNTDENRLVAGNSKFLDLYLRHNNNGDGNISYYYGYVSFKLDKNYLNPEVMGIKLHARPTGGDVEETTFQIKY